MKKKNEFCVAIFFLKKKKTYRIPEQSSSDLHSTAEFVMVITAVVLVLVLVDNVFVGVPTVTAEDLVTGALLYVELNL